MFTYIEVIQFNPRKVVKRIDVTGKTSNQIDKIDRGLNINLNHERYFSLEKQSEKKLKTI